MLLAAFVNVDVASSAGTEPTTIPQCLMSLNQRQTCQSWQGGVKCWGENTVSDPQYVGGATELVDIPPIDDYDLGDVDGAFNVSTVHCGGSFTCAVSIEGKARCWGLNRFAFVNVME